MSIFQRTARAAVPAVAALALTGCGAFKSSGISDRYKPNDPNRIADRVEAVISNNSPFTVAAPAATATFRATLYDANGRQFFGPEVLLDGTAVETDKPGSDTSTAYVKPELPYTPGQTYTVAVQGHSATTSPAPPPLVITSPKPSQDDKGATLGYIISEPDEPLTITWSGGDPGQNVYITLYGSPDQNGARRLFVADNPAMSPLDPLNLGLPIPNTGSYTIPAQLTERVVTADGTTSRTVTTFDNPSKSGSPANILNIAVTQRSESLSGPIRFTIATSGSAAAGVVAYK